MIILGDALMKNIIVKDKIINITGITDDDFVSLTDIARFINNDDPRYPIQNWMRLKDTIDFLGLWEILNNENLTASNSTPLKQNMEEIRL